jgi:hypothetical protein
LIYYSAAAVATASLIKTVEEEIISPEDIVMLNITGGGEEILNLIGRYIPWNLGIFLVSIKTKMK